MLERGLQPLSATVNVGTCVTHPSDRSAAIALLEMLREAGEPYDAGEVRA